MNNLSRGFGEPTQRVQALREQILNASPRIETDRARILTESYKETESLPMVLRRAKALEKILAELPVIIRSGELIVGSLTVEPHSAQVFPEFSNQWLLNEFDRLNQRTGDRFTISEEAKRELAAIFPYWQGKTTSELATSYMMQDTLASIEENVFTVGNYYFNGVGHIAVDYAKVLHKGFKGIMQDVLAAMDAADKRSPDYLKQEAFFKAVLISCNAAINFAHRYARKAREMADDVSPQRRSELMEIARICETVPENGASSFYEACQSFWLTHAIIQIESNGHSISPARFDQYMYPFLAQDHSITPEMAQELLDCLWIKFNDINKVRDEDSTKGFGGYPMFQNLIVGGQTRGGLDATNPLSYMAMTATAHVSLHEPSFSVRIWAKSPDDFLLKACEVSRLGMGIPAYYNDEVIIPALINRGLSLEDARDYGIIGCVEPQSPGKTEGWHDAAFFNMSKVLEIALNNGRSGTRQLGPKTGEIADFHCFDDVLEAYRKQMAWFVHHLTAADNSVDLAHAERAPLPFLSCMVDDCISRGKTVQEGGAHYNFTGPQGVGVANVGDSLMAIKRLVFEEGRVSLAHLKEALDSNFGLSAETPSVPAKAEEGEVTYDMVLGALKKILGENSGIDLSALAKPAEPVAQGSLEALRQMLINGVPKFGNDIDEVDMMARAAAEIYCREVEKYRNPRSGVFQAGLYPVSANVAMGTAVGATADGRLAGEPLPDGVSPSRGMDCSGPTAAANSVAKLDHALASNGTLFNQKFHPAALKGEDGLHHLAALLRGFFDQKGMHVQFNVVDRSILLAAQKEPEKYRDLVVRVAGYSAQFVSLDKSVQDDIIMRTEHSF
ncbi:glycyl radical protein [Superficieibacter sp. BNK-5]|uniref:glycyl radical protein n=1 Tax=Superficieibacter sp. BNK-5 TaxID=3376142 RepID=UPI0039BF4387